MNSHSCCLPEVVLRCLVLQQYLACHAGIILPEMQLMLAAPAAAENDQCGVLARLSCSQLFGSHIQTMGAVMLS